MVNVQRGGKAAALAPVFLTLLVLPPRCSKTPSFSSCESFEPLSPLRSAAAGSEFCTRGALEGPARPVVSGRRLRPAAVFPEERGLSLSLSFLSPLCRVVLGLQISGVGLCCVSAWISLGSSCLTHVQPPHSAGFYVFCQIWEIFRDYFFSCFFSLVLLLGL